MKLGEIKVQSLSIMYPSANVTFDDTSDESIERAIFELKSDPNLSSVLESIIGSVNRCLTRLENKDLSHTKCHDIPLSLCQRRGDSVILTLPQDFLRAMRLMAHKDGKTYICGYEVLGDKMVTDFVGTVYTLVYKTKIVRVTRSTSNSYDIDLPNGVAELIPYYVKGDLYLQEDYQEAKEAMDMFERDTSYLADSEVPCNACFQIIYAVEQG